MGSKDDFKIRPNVLPKSDKRYKKWRKSLKRRPAPWNKGKTKKTHPSIKKMARTFRRNKIDNFTEWRDGARKKGLIPSYRPFKKSKKLALLIGLILGDGNLYKFPRTEKLTLSLGTDKPELVNFAYSLMEEVFHKKPSVSKPKEENVKRISIYQKYLSERLEVPLGSRRYSKKGIPSWIWKFDKYLVSCLRGLFEAEGSLNIHKKTYTYNFAFSNSNEKLLEDVKNALFRLGFSPETRSYAIRLRKKNEVKYFANLISFRKYDAGLSNW